MCEFLGGRRATAVNAAEHRIGGLIDRIAEALGELGVHALPYIAAG